MIVGLENQFVVFLRVAVLHRFYCMVLPLNQLALYERKSLHMGQDL